MSLLNRTTHLAFILDDKGEELLNVIKLNPKENTFKCGLRKYIFKPDVSTTLIQDKWYWLKEKRHYYYNYSNPMPLKLKRDYQVPLTSEELNIFIDTEVLRKLNNLAKKNWLLELLTPLNIIIAVVVIGLLYWYFGIMHGHLGK